MRTKKLVVIGIFVLLSGLLALYLMPIGFALEPFGATVNATNISRAPADVAGSDEAWAGNVTELVLNGFSNTQTWQGYYGNVSGTIQLADSSDYVMYNWTAATPSGEVYASVNQSISWLNIQCFNFTASGVYTAEAGAGGNTSLYGTNLTQLEQRYNLNASDVDGVDETFYLLGGGGHDLFYTANQQFSEGECRNTRVFGDTGAGVSDEFEEVLLYEPSTRSVIFAALIENDMGSFNTKTADFEMLVLEDGHGTDVDATTYYFFVELE